MENASKGLLIAAAVLIVIMLVTMGIKVLSPTKDIIEESGNIGSTIKTSSQSAVDKIQAGIGVQKGTVDGTITEEEDNQIKIGDYVNYKSNKGESDLKWRVLGKNNSGQLELISATPTEETLTLSGEDGYNRAISELDKMCSVYGKGKNASGARSLRVEDINKVTGITDFSTVDKDYGTKWQYRYTEDGKFQYKKYASDGVRVLNDWKDTYDQGEFRQPGKVTLSKLNPGTSDIITYDYYYYKIGVSGIESELFRSYNHFWLASLCNYCWENGDGAFWGCRFVASDGGVGFQDLLTSFGGNSNRFHLRPVVLLKSSVKLMKNGDGTWDIL